MDACLGEEGEDSVGVGLDAVGEPVPVGAVDRALERADLESVLHIDRQGVQHC